MLALTPRQLLPDSEDLTVDGAVVKRVTVPGSASGTPTTGSPPPGSFVKVRFVGRTVDMQDCTSGAVFDSSAQRMECDVPFRANLGTGTFIAGLELALAGMARGETALLACAAEHAYGAHGALPEVAPGATVAYEVTLCTFRPPLVGPGTLLTPEGRMAGAVRLKAVGPTASSIWFVPPVTTVPYSLELREGTGRAFITWDAAQQTPVDTIQPTKPIAPLSTSRLELLRRGRVGGGGRGVRRGSHGAASERPTGGIAAAGSRPHNRLLAQPGAVPAAAAGVDAGRGAM